MSVCLGEQLRKPEVPYRSLARQRYSFELLSQEDFFRILDDLISSGRLTTLGKEFYSDVKEIPILKDPSVGVVFARSLDEARQRIDQLLAETPGYVGYITGGLEGGFLQLAIGALLGKGEMDPLIIGLEEDKYVASKGREPLFSTQEKASLWMRIARDNSIVFIIPPRPESIPPHDYHDWIAKRLGIFQNSRVVYFGAKDDPQEILIAHNRRAASLNHLVTTSFGPPHHTSDLLIK